MLRRPEFGAFQLSGRIAVQFAALVAALAVVAGACALAGATLAPPWPAPTRAQEIGLVPVSLSLAVAGWLHVQFQDRRAVEALDLFVAGLAPLLLVFPTPVAVAVTAGAKAAAEIALRVPLVKAGFNVVQWSAAAGVGSLILGVLAGSNPRDSSDLPALLAALLVVLALNHLAVVSVLAVTDRRPPASVLASLRGVVVPGWLLGGSAEIAAGVLFALAFLAEPLSAALLPVPLILLHRFAGYLSASRVERLRLRGLQRATSALLHVDREQPLDSTTALPDFLREVQACFDCEQVTLALRRGGAVQVHQLSSWLPGSDEATQQTRSSYDDAAPVTGLVAALLAEGRPARLDVREPGTSGGDLSAALSAEGWRDCIAAPVHADGHPVGTLLAFNRIGLPGYQEGEVAVLQALADELGLALHGVELLKSVLEERLRLTRILDFTSDGIATLDREGTVLSWNPGFELLTGYGREQVLGRPLAAQLALRDEAGRPAELFRWIDGVDLLPSELQIRQRSGERRWLSCAYSAMPSPAGEDSALILVARDVTETRRLAAAQQAVRDTQARFRALVQHSSDVVTVLDAGGLVVYSSPATATVLELPRGQSLTGPFWPVVHPDDRLGLQQRIGALRSAPGSTQRLDFRVRTGSGVYRYLEASVTNLLDDPRVGGIVLNSRDVTARRRGEALLAGQVSVLRRIATDEQPEAVLAELAALVEEQLPTARAAALLHDAGHLRLVPGPRFRPRERDAVYGEALSAPSSPWMVAEACGRLVVAAGTPPESEPPPASAAGAAPPDVPGEAPGTRAVLPPALRALGVGTCWAMPLQSREDGTSAGCLLVVFDGVRPPAPSDHQLLELAARLGSLGEERARARARLTHQAMHDPLTGLPNRVVFLDRAALALRRSSRDGTAVAVLFLDLDGFKLINDSLGHNAGDRLLTVLSERLQETLRPGDTVARFGGDEFTILCEGVADESGALQVAERVTSVLARPFPLRSGEFYLSASVGVALARDGSPPPEVLVENADAAMYRAKERGGNQSVLFDEHTRTRAKRRLATQNALYRAVQEGEFRVYYQPTVSLGTGEVVGFEALVRWQHPRRGLLCPADFIRLAEETGLIVPIGTMVLEEACRQAEQWQDRWPDRPPPWISVNLSARQFVHPELLPTVAASVNRLGGEPGRLSLEITESVLMEDAESTNVALRQLKALGVGLSIDDFGTGYSSLTYLKRFPVDVLKVDRAFVHGLGAEPEDTAIVASVINLAHTMGLTCVAEGVETPRQLAELRRLGCDVGQGYLFGAPAPSATIDLTDRDSWARAGLPAG